MEKKCLKVYQSIESCIEVNLMLLNEEQVRLINWSWEALSSKPKSMIRFYDHLFDISPETRHFFPDDITKQSEKIGYSIGFIVDNLSKLHDIKDEIEALGRFHNKLHIEPNNYINVKVAFIKTIQEYLGESYHDEIGKAWDLALSYVSDLMITSSPKKKKKRFIKIISRRFF